MGSDTSEREENEEKIRWFRTVIDTASNLFLNKYSMEEIIDMPYKDLKFKIDAEIEKKRQIENEQAEQLNKVNEPQQKSFSEIWKGRV